MLFIVWGQASGSVKCFKNIRKHLFKRKTAEKALELASWLRIEMGNLRLELKAKQATLLRYEKSLNRLEGMLAEPKQRDAVGIKKRNNCVVEYICRDKGVLAVIEFAERNFGVGVDKCLLVYMPDALDIAHS